MRNRARVASLALLISCILPVPGVASGAPSPAMPYDFNGDAYADLTVGVPYEDVGARRDAGTVQVLYGSPSGPTTRDQLWHQNRRGVRGTAERGDLFGSALASADFDGDGYADLAVGVPGESIRGRRAGAVHILYGSPRGLTAAGDQVWHQNTRGVPGGNQTGDEFGATLAAADFDADGFADLAIGLPGEDALGLPDTGRVLVLRGSASGLTSRGAQKWDESVLLDGIAHVPGTADRFGSALAIGDVDADGMADLAIATGVWRDASSLRRGIHVLRGARTGLTTIGSQFLFGTPELTRSCVEDDCSVPFGDLVLADFNGDGRDDLGHAVIPGRVVVRFSHDGAFGSRPAEPEADDPGVDRSWAIGPDDGLRQVGGPADVVGRALAAGDLNGDHIADLVIGAPGWDSDGTGIGVGAVFVVPGSSGLMPASVGMHAAGEVPGDRLGSSLAILPMGDAAWLAIGTPGDVVSGRAGAGSLLVCAGMVTPFEGGCTTWSQDTPGIRESAERWDRFAESLG